MYGVAESRPAEAAHPGACARLARMPLATMPWWKSLAMMNENKGVFGLNMLSWWDARGPRPGPRAARRGLAAGDYARRRRGFPFERAADAHRFIAERRNVGKVVLTARAPATLHRDRDLASVGSEFQREIVDTGRLAGFLFFVALLGTFGFIRTSAYLIHKQVRWWPGNVSVGGTHVHHLVWGIFAMMIFGYLGIVFQPDSPWREIVAVLFAIGMGLTLDEFALWLELKDVYWTRTAASRSTR